MSKTYFTLAVLLAALMLPLESFAQRGGGGGRGGSNPGGSSNAGRGGNNFSGVGRGSSYMGGGRGGSNFGIGVGPGGIYVGPSRGWNNGYGNWSRYGYPGRYSYGYRYGNPYFGNNYGYGANYGYGGTTYYSPSYTESVPIRNDYQGLGVAIRNGTDHTIHFTVDDQRQMAVEPRETIRLADSPQFLIAFDRGSSFGSARYSIHEGLYEFTPSERGWELFRQKEGSVVLRPNETPATPRTAARSIIDPLPLDDHRDIDGRIDGDFRGPDRADPDLERRDLELPTGELPRPVPQPDNPIDE